MKKTLAFAAVALFAAGTIPAGASPDTNPVNAANTSSDSGCFVRGGESDPYQYDPTCTSHIVEKLNKDGSLAWWRYQDKGTLQSGNVAPETAVQIDIQLEMFGGTCFGKEVITPDGHYSSDMVCKR